MGWERGLPRRPDGRTPAPKFHPSPTSNPALTRPATTLPQLSLPADDCEVVLVDADGQALADSDDPARAVAVEARDAGIGDAVARAERNGAGSFYRIYQPNKWRMKKEREAREREAAAAGVGA